MPKSEEELDRLSCTSVERPVKSSGMLSSCYLSAISRAKILQTVLLKSIPGKIELSLSGEFSEIRFVLWERACRATFPWTLLHRRGMFRHTSEVSRIYFANVAFLPQGFQSAESGAK
jgi:hypothetical protein